MQYLTVQLERGLSFNLYFSECLQTQIGRFQETAKLANVIVHSSMWSKVHQYIDTNPSRYLLK